MRNENNKIVEEGKKVKKKELAFFDYFIDFFQIALYLTLFVLKRYLASDFIASNYKSRV